MDERLRKRLEKQSQTDRRIADSRRELLISTTESQKAITEISKDHQRVQNIIDHSSTVIEDIHRKFKDETKLNEKDIAFLFGAVSLQMLRWILMPRMDFDLKKIAGEDRLNATQGGKIEKDGIKQILKDNGYSLSDIKRFYNQGHIRNYTWQQLLIAPVPYDAMQGSKNVIIDGVTELGKNVYGKNHHSATWGHDPIVGWVIGPLNITARMITFRNFETYYVAQVNDTFNQYITKRTNIGNMLHKSFDAWKDDSKKLFVSVAKQRLHFESDKYTKMGLPIPLVSPEKAQKLLEKGWNSNEMERLFNQAAKNLLIVGAQFGVAFAIDQLVKALHLLCYDEVEDGSISTYQYKTQKILCYSTGMAEIANGIYVAATRDIGKLDIGGYINFAKNLITSVKLKNQIETEFLEKELSKKIYGDEYYWEAKP